MRQPRAKKFAWSLALILAGLTVWCLWATWETKRAAKQFFLEAQQVEIGRATAGQVLRLVHSTHRRTNGGFAPCQSGEGECSGTVFFDNIWLYRLHLAPAVVFACRFDIKNNKLQERWVEMVSSNDGREREERSSTKETIQGLVAIFRGIPRKRTSGLVAAIRLVISEYSLRRKRHLTLGALRTSSTSPV